jgi:hypothetical protein
MDERVCEMAAKGGHIACLKYAHKSGCTWTKKTCEQAAKHGHVKCLRYAHMNNCPWDEDTFIMAFYYHQLRCLVYLWIHGCPYPSNMTHHIYEMIKWYAANRIADVWVELYWSPYTAVGIKRLLRNYHK